MVDGQNLECPRCKKVIRFVKKGYFPKGWGDNWMCKKCRKLTSSIRRCEVCGRIFKSKRARYCSKYCRSICNLNYPAHKGKRVARKLQLICDHCGEEFWRFERDHMGWKKDGYIHLFCSGRCSREFHTTKVCIDCGSPDIYEHGKKYKGKRCKECFDKWYPTRNSIDLKCSKCGKIKTLNHAPRKAERTRWRCKECRKPKVIRIPGRCKICGSRIQKGMYCSMKCYDISRRDRQKGHHRTKPMRERINEGVFYCADCGMELDKKNCTHGSVGRTCDRCIYIRRTEYKNKGLPQKVIFLDLLTRINLRRDIPWREKKEILQRASNKYGLNHLRI